MTVAAAAEGLATMVAGPELAAALHAVVLPRVPNDRMLDVLVAQYQQLCHEQARMAAVLAELTRCGGVPAAGGVSREEEPDPYASAETRAALRWTRRSADAEHDLAEMVVHGMPLVFVAWLAGQVDRPRVRVFYQYLTGLTPEQVQRICRVAVPRAPKLTTGTTAVTTGQRATGAATMAAVTGPAGHQDRARPAPARRRQRPISGSGSRSGSAWRHCWASTNTRPRSPASGCWSHRTPGCGSRCSTAPSGVLR